MIKSFLRERMSWIVLFLFLQLLLIFVAFIDSAIPLLPVLYIVFLSLIIFLLFLVIRFQKETKFYKGLEEWENHLELSSVVYAKSPFEKIVEESLVVQTKQLKVSSAYNQMMLEQEKDELLAWIHEVKTPLTAMHLMIDRLDDEEMKAHLTYEWLRIHLLLDQQLHHKRIPFMENDLYMEYIELKPLLIQEIKMLQSWCMQKEIGFELDLEVTEVLSDAKWLAFIIRQLLTNAVKYSPASDIHIKSYEKNGHQHLEVQDFGRGIDIKDLPRIFDKGFTSTTKHQDQSATGMGLYLTKQVAIALSIEIHVHSSLGVGTTFTLTFPQKNEMVQITGV